MVTVWLGMVWWQWQQVRAGEATGLAKGQGFAMRHTTKELTSFGQCPLPFAFYHVPFTLLGAERVRLLLFIAA